eukprot:1139749-Pelagomonas_calceolata.AAC.2
MKATQQKRCITWLFACSGSVLICLGSYAQSQCSCAQGHILKVSASLGCTYAQGQCSYAQGHILRVLCSGSVRPWLVARSGSAPIRGHAVCLAIP